MNGVIDTLNFTNSNNEISNLYPRTLVEAITNKKGETLESLLKKSGNNSSGTTSVESSDSASRFTINGSNLATGWYQVANVNDGYSCSMNIMDACMMDDSDYPCIVNANILSTEFSEITGSFDIINNATFEIVSPYVGFDKIAIVELEDTNGLFLHYTNPGYAMQACTVTITSLMNGELNVMGSSSSSLKTTPCTDTFTLACEEFEYESDILVSRDFNLSSIGNTEDITSASSNQFTTFGMILESGWYKIGKTSPDIPYDCMVHIYDNGETENGDYFQFHADVLLQGYGNGVKVLDCAINGDFDLSSYVGFTRFEVLHDNEDGNYYLCAYYNNPGYSVQGSILTVTNLFAGQISLGSNTMDIGITPCGGTFIPLTGEDASTEANVIFQDTTTVATTADLIALRNELLGAINEISELVGGM